MPDDLGMDQLFSAYVGAYLLYRVFHMVVTAMGGRLWIS
jgi:hypothetical protein